MAPSCFCLPAGLKRRAFRGALFLTLFLALLLVVPLAGTGAPAAQDRPVLLRAEFPVDLAPPPSVAAFSGLVDPAYTARIPDGAAAAALLAEARWTFAGIIWGFDYLYTPSDRARAISEVLEIKPRSPEAAAAMSPRAVAARLEGTVLVATVEYTPDTEQSRELASWKSLSAVEQGLGSSAFGSARAGTEAAAAAVDARREAISAAVREALRAQLREYTHNKPREVRGSFAFAAPPRLFVRDGRWIASVRIYARVDAIESYGAY